MGDTIIELNGVYASGRLADALGAHAHYMHAPMIVTDSAVRDGPTRNPYIRKSLTMTRRANIWAVRSGLINVLVTDENAAREMLDVLGGDTSRLNSYQAHE